MPNITKSPEADEDLFSLWYYIAIDNRPAADKLIRRINEIFLLLADNLGMGVWRTDLQYDLRCHALDKYLIFYRKVTDGIYVVRVLHSARDIYKVMHDENNL